MEFWSQPVHLLIHLQTFSEDIGVSTIVLAVIISPIAGEMPEKISMMILARKGAAGAAIAIANVLGSKILNNSLLLGVAIIAAMYHGGFFTTIPNSEIIMVSDDASDFNYRSSIDSIV